MKRILLALVASATIAMTGMTANSAEAGHPGFYGNRHSHLHRQGHPHRHGHPRHVQRVYRPPVFYQPYVAPPVVYQPYVYYPPQNTFFYQSRNFGLSFGW